MTEKTAHPRFALDETIHSPVRLSIVSALAEADEIDFAFLRDMLEVSDSLLSKHIAVLEKAGYVAVKKGFIGKRPHTWLSITDEGLAAYRRYLDALRRIIGPRPLTKAENTADSALRSAD